MKKITSLLVVLLITSFSLQAQESQEETVPKKWTFGVKLGMTETTEGRLDVIGGNQSGYYVGGFVDYRLSERWVVQSGLIFNSNNFQSYEIPLTVRYYITPKFSVLGGFKFNFNFDSSRFRLDAQNDITYVNNKLITPGIDIGFQYEPTKNFFVEFKYSKELTDSYYKDNFFFGNTRVEGLSLGVGFKF